MNAVRNLFTLQGRVTRSRYLATGLLLALLKYAADTGSFMLLAGERWELLDYLNPARRWGPWDPDDYPTALYVFVVLWALPFMWIGVAIAGFLTMQYTRHFLQTHGRPGPIDPMLRGLGSRLAR